MQHHLHETKRPTATPATHKSYLSVPLCSKFHVLFDFCNHIWLLHSLRESHIFLIFFVGHLVHICVRNVSKHVTFSFFALHTIFNLLICTHYIMTMPFDQWQIAPGFKFAFAPGPPRSAQKKRTPLPHTQQHAASRAVSSHITTTKSPIEAPITFQKLYAVVVCMQ